MSDVALHRTPSLGGVIVRQALLLWRTRRAPALLALMAGTVLFFDLREKLVCRTLAEGVVRLYYVPPLVDVQPLLWFIGFGWALMVWWGETRGRRDYLASLPVAHGTHLLTRVAAGAVWLIAGCAIFALAGLLLATGLQRVFLDAAPAAFWVHCFTVALIPYAVASAFLLALDRPLSWMVAVAAVVTVGLFGAVHARSASTADSVESAAQTIIGPIYEGAFGIESAMHGGVRTAHIAAQLATGRRPLWSASYTAAESVAAALLWTLVAALLVVVASRRRPD